ncbi:MAG TPA: hypothetical protein VMT67_12690 [Terriglobales bacterium]|nr:hypothetical protein [Terriglobales bacterium]
MIAIPLLALVLVGAPQDSSTPPPTTKESTTGATTAPRWTPEQEKQIKQKEEQIRLSRAPARQEAVRINDLAANIHSEADARQLVNAVAEELTHHKHLFWSAQRFRHRVARAEFDAVTEGALVPEDRVVGVWNEYVREIEAPEETVITAEELHHFRVVDFQMSQRNWQRELTQSIWSMPNVYAADSAGSLADGCRALESLKLINNLHEQFSRVHFARVAVQNETATAGVQKRPEGMLRGPTMARGRLASGTTAAPAGHFHPYEDPIRPAVRRYVQEHGQQAYDQLVRRLFDELFPAE